MLQGTKARRRGIRQSGDCQHGKHTDILGARQNYKLAKFLLDFDDITLRQLNTNFR